MAPAKTSKRKCTFGDEHAKNRGVKRCEHFCGTLLTQPNEILTMIVKELTFEDLFNLSLASKTARSRVSFFRANFTYDFVDNMFKSITCNDEKYRNLRYMFTAMNSTVRANKLDLVKKFYDWLADAPTKCPNFPVSMLFEIIMENWGEEQAMLLITRLIRHWMQVDADICMDAFPVTESSPQEHIDAEKRLLQHFRAYFSHTLKDRTKTFLFSLTLRCLAETDEAYKLLVMLCAPRTDGFVNLEDFANIHSGDAPDYGDLVHAFEWLMGSWTSRINCGFSQREVFVIFEDLTTSPVVWSMFCFVKFLMQNQDLCVLSTCVRFTEGYRADAGSIFYYLIRAGAPVCFLNRVVSAIAKRLPTTHAMHFADHVLNTSRAVILATNPSNRPRLAMLLKAHGLAFDVLGPIRRRLKPLANKEGFNRTI